MVKRWGAALAVAVAMSACEGRPDVLAPSATIPTTPSPAPLRTLSGRVLETTSQGTRPIAGAQIEIGVTPPPAPPGPFRCGSACGPWGAISDAEGRYVVPELPDRSFVVLRVGATLPPDRRGLSQQCAATVTMDADAVLDLELVSQPPAPRTIPAPPTLSGVVYQTTSAGRQPVRGKGILYDWQCDDGSPDAGTVTDSSGGYELCRLPVGAACVYVVNAGGNWQQFYTFVRGDTVLDIDIGASSTSAAHALSR